MPGRRSKYLRRSRKRSRCKAGPYEFCCNAVTLDGSKCERKATVMYGLSNSILTKVFPFLKNTDCCYFCTQHMKMIVNFLLAKGFTWILKRTIRNIYNDSISGKMAVGDFESLEKYATEHGLI